MTVETATVSVLTMLMTVVANERVGTGAPTVMKTVSGAQVAPPPSAVWAKASGSEARATSGPSDALKRILPVATAQDAKIVTLLKRKCG